MTPKKLATLPATVTDAWKDLRALLALTVSPDLTDEEIRALALHRSRSVIGNLLILRPTLPRDVVVRLARRAKRMQALIAGRPELPMDVLIEMLEMPVSEWAQAVMVTRLRHRAADEGLTANQLTKICCSTNPQLRNEGVRLAPFMKKVKKAS